MSNPTLDSKLQDFLDSFDRDQRRGDTMANMRLLIGGLATKVDVMAADLGALRGSHRRLKQEVRAIRSHVGMDGDDMDTGQHEVAELKTALADAERRAVSGMWWKQNTIKWAVGAAGGVGTLALGALVTYFFTHVH